MEIHSQLSAYHSPWTNRQRFKMFLWDFAWAMFCSWTPKPANSWRLFWLRIFGAHIFGKPFVHQRARIRIPWNLSLFDRAAIGDRTNIYSLDKIEVREHATIAQEAYICTGTHAFDQQTKNLITSPIIIEAHAFIGARAFIMPGLVIGKGAIVGSCSVVTKSVLPYATVAGNPAKVIKTAN